MRTSIKAFTIVDAIKLCMSLCAQNIQDLLVCKVTLPFKSRMKSADAGMMLAQQAGGKLTHSTAS